MEIFDSRVNEFIIQALWNEQDFCRDLVTDDSQSLIIHYPGTWNYQEGPDFRDAVISINGQKICGDVEIHFRTADWNSHGHQNDPKYDKVILHVVWERGQVPKTLATLPLLELKKHCTMSLNQVVQKYQIQAYGRQQQIKPVSFAKQLSEISDSELQKLLERASTIRLKQKMSVFKSSVTTVGHEQTLYLGLMDIMGFSKNRKAFIELAKTVPIKKLLTFSPREREAILWGESGLLPDVSQKAIHPTQHEILQQLWDLWWPFRREFIGQIKWTHLGRPANSPERRLAGLIEFLHSIDWQLQEFFERIIDAINRNESIKQLLNNSFHTQSHWQSFMNFEKELTKPMQLIGASRLRELEVNLLLPALLHSACTQGDINITKIIKLYQQVPKGEITSLLKEAACRFFIPPSRMKLITKNFIHQQGLYQLLKQPQILERLLDDQRSISELLISDAE